MNDAPSSPSTVAGALASDATAVGAPPSVRRLGRYTLLERLGVGGMAEVYLAQQDGAVGFQKKVVVKRILPHLASNPLFVDMFAREAKVAARLSHTNVVQIFELGEGGGELFIAMEYLDGITLHRLATASWDQGHAVAVDVVLRTAADAASGLHAAHDLADEQGRPLHLVHRDVSPDNLMVSRDGVTKVLDFGIAKGDLGGPKTKTGHLRGKIPFMPPEQVTGGQLDGRADLYALGVSMYWMLTGERPFDRQSDWHTMYAILHDEPKPASSLNPAVPAGLDALIGQLLAKDRAGRPATGREVAERLEELATPGSVGGKKTTQRFLADLLPTVMPRGNPLSEPALPPAFVSLGSEASALGTVSVTVSSPPVLQPPDEPASAPLGPQPAPHEAEIPATVAVAGRAIAEPPRDEAPQSSVRPAIQPVTTPAAENAFADVLVPRPRSSAPVAAIAGALVVALVVTAALVAVVRGGPAPPAHPSSTPPSSAPPSSAPPPSTPPPSTPPLSTQTAPSSAPPRSTQTARTVEIKAVQAPARIRWRAGDSVVGVGSGALTVPAGTHELIAEDLRWGSRAVVAVVDGAVDYRSVPTGVVQLRIDEGTTVRLGDDDVSRQRRLTLPVGHYVFVVERNGRRRDVAVDVTAGKTLPLDAVRQLAR